MLMKGRHHTPQSQRMMTRFRCRAALSAHIAAATLGALLIAAAFDTPAGAQSFDCRNARSADEKAICQDSRLGDLDKQLADVYDRAGGKLSKQERRNSKTTRPHSSMRAAGAVSTEPASSRAIATGFRNSSRRCRKINPAARGALARRSARTGQRPRATAVSPRTCRPEQRMPSLPSEKPRSRRRNEPRSTTIVNPAPPRHLRRRRAPVPASPRPPHRRCPIHHRGVRPKRRSLDRPRRKSTRVVSPAPRVWRWLPPRSNAKSRRPRVRLRPRRSMRRQRSMRRRKAPVEERRRARPGASPGDIHQHGGSGAASRSRQQHSRGGRAIQAAGKTAFPRETRCERHVRPNAGISRSSTARVRSGTARVETRNQMGQSGAVALIRAC